MTTPFRTRRRVEFAETDMAGIAHFSNFFRWMESAEVDFLRSRGISVTMEWQGQRIGFPRVSASCDFLRPVRFLDEIEIVVQLTRVGSKSISYSFDFFKDGEPAAKGRISAVCCRIHGENQVESMEIPRGIREALQDPNA